MYNIVGHVERTDEYRMTRRVLMADVSLGRVRDRQTVQDRPTETTDCTAIIG